jgi:hypothetical protein
LSAENGISSRAIDSDQPQRGRLARARRAEHREELAAHDLEVDVVHGDHVAEGLAYADEDECLRRRREPQARRV